MPYSDSASADASLALYGVWLHDPLDAEGTVSNHLYGGAVKDTSVDTVGIGAMYAGRTYTVVDYGEHEEESVGVTVHVPFGATWVEEMATLSEWARAKRTVWMRDGRGRSLAGALSGFKVDDAPWGSVVAFTVQRVHYAQEEVSA